ncbi:MAG: O-antigen ligase family protein [Thermodesulfobacteriota bacterium]
MRMDFSQGSRSQVILLAGIILLACVAGFLVSQVRPVGLITAVLAVSVFVVAFMDPEVGLYLLIFSMLLSPEITVGEATSRTTLSRGVTLRLDDFLLAVIGLAWFARTAVKKDLGLFLRTPLNRPIFYYIIICCLSTAIGVVAGRVQTSSGFFFVLKYIEYFIVYFMVANHIRDREQVKRFLFCILLTSILISGYGLLQVPGGGRVSAPFEGTVGEPNTLGGYLMFIGFLTLGLLHKTRSSRETSFYVLVLAAMLLPFVFTESRASYIGAFVATIAFSVLIRRKGIVITLIVLMGISSPLWLPQRVKDRIMLTFSQQEHPRQVQFAGIHLDTSTSARLLSMKEAYRDWTKKPVFGFGVTGYEFLDSQYAKVLVETGIFGLVAFFYLIYCVFRIARDNLRNLNDSLYQGISIGYMAGFIGLLTHALGANTFIIVRIMEPFWFLTGIMVMLPVLEKREAEALAQLPESAEPRVAPSTPFPGVPRQPPGLAAGRNAKPE